MEEVTSHCEIRLSRATAAVGRQGASLLAAAPYVGPQVRAARLVCRWLARRSENKVRATRWALRAVSARRVHRAQVFIASFTLPPSSRDGIDVSGWEVDEATGIVWQAAIGVPTALPGYPAALTEYYPPAFRSVDMVWGYKLEPLAAQRTRLTLVCQHDLRNWMVPNFLMNRMVGDVLADYVRTAERVGRKLVAEGKAAALRAKHGLE
jgi:hypothetical protein